jgi:hypothetical protein
MHWTLGAIVIAEDAEDAVALAESSFDRLVQDSHPFDYFTIYKDQVMRVKTVEGKKAVEELMEATREDFIENLQKLRSSLSVMSDEDAFSYAAEFNVRYRAYQIGKYIGGGIFLYDQDGAGIRSPEKLKAIVFKDDSYLRKPKGVMEWRPDEPPTLEDVDDDVWIVLADAHS